MRKMWRIEGNNKKQEEKDEKIKGQTEGKLKNGWEEKCTICWVTQSFIGWPKCEQAELFWVPFTWFPPTSTSEKISKARNAGRKTNCVETWELVPTTTEMELRKLPEFRQVRSEEKIYVEFPLY